METPNTQWADAFLDEMRMQADPMADDLIRKIVADEGNRAAQDIFNLLIRNIEIPLDQLPAVVADFVSHTCHLPDWADPGLMKQAEEVFLDHGPKFLVFLYYKSLPTLYACKHGAQVLVMTGRLAHKASSDQFTRRIAETGQFILDVMSPGGMEPGGRGIEAAQKVRLVHAAIRHFIPAEAWDEATLGKPINQEDLATTLMTFSISMIEAMEIVGIALDPEEAEAYLHRWKVVGTLLGIRPELIPASVTEGKALIAKTLSRQAAPSEAGTLLTNALIVFGEKTIPTRILDPSPRVLIRFLAGKEMAGLLGVKPAKGCLAFLIPRLMRKYLGLIDNLEDISEPLDMFMDKFSARLMLKMASFFNTHKGTSMRVTPEVRKRWGIS